MLTIKQLDDLKQSFSGLFSRTHCVSCSQPGKVYAYFMHAFTDPHGGTIYIECAYHLAQDKQKYKNVTIIELSEKEVFYLQL